MEYLVSKGIKYGENGLMSTTAHHKSWYVTETPKILSLLNLFRKENTIVITK